MSNPITAHAVFSSEKLFPVYAQYAGQFQPQPAYLSLDIRTGAVDADYSGEIGNAVSSDVWHGLILTFPINSQTTHDSIQALIADNLPKFQQILNGTEHVWNGSNWVGQSNEEVAGLINTLERELECNDESGVNVCTLAEFLQDELFPSSDKGLASFIAELAELNGENGYYYSTEHTVNHDDLRDELLDLWAEHLYSGYDLPQQAAITLLEDGRCKDSAWTDELREFAQAE